MFVSLVSVLLLVSHVARSQVTVPTCEQAFDRYLNAIESRRLDACRSTGGAAVPATILAPVLDAITVFLREQPEPLAGFIPKAVFQGVDTYRQLLTGSTINICDENQFRGFSGASIRQVPQIETVVTQFCTLYSQFTETAQGQAFTEQLTQLWEQALAAVAQAPTEGGANDRFPLVN